MNTQMKEIGYDDKRSPLGLLAKSNIDRGYLALQRILSVLKNDYTGNVCVVRSEAEKRKELNEASSEFYSAIPHDFGYMNLKAFILDTKDKVQPKLEMLASLNEIQICSKLMNDRSKGDGLNDIDRKYLKLNCQIEVLPKGTKIYESLMKYVENTHGKTHDKYTL